MIIVSVCNCLASKSIDKLELSSAKLSSLSLVEAELGNDSCRAVGVESEVF